MSQTGLIVVNLGSPDSPTSGDVRRYLAEFLHDRRVIDTSRWIWCPILHGIILRIRPARSAKLYQIIWDQPDGEGGGEAPLVRITRRQAAGLQSRFGDNVIVETAMRYGNPSISLAFDRLLAKGCRQIAVLPLYPQYAGATTAAVYDGVANSLKSRADVPDIRILRSYHDDPAYISLLADCIRQAWAELGWKPDCILASFHGIPQSYVDKGDPYSDECMKTTDLLRENLDLSADELRLTFQSRFGPKAWLQPYTDIVLGELPKQGIKNVMILTPGFSADCLETLEEINIEARKTFLSAGGENFAYVPCLNDSEGHLDFLAELTRDQLLPGWL